MDKEQLIDSAGELMDDLGELTGLDPVVAAIAIGVLIILAVIIFTKPLRFVIKVAINTAVGFAALILINQFGAQFGIALDVNWFNAVVTGVLGLPGVAVLIALRWMGYL